MNWLKQILISICLLIVGLGCSSGPKKVVSKTKLAEELLQVSGVKGDLHRANQMASLNDILESITIINSIHPNHFEYISGLLTSAYNIEITYQKLVECLAKEFTIEEFVTLLNQVHEFHFSSFQKGLQATASLPTKKRKKLVSDYLVKYHHFKHDPERKKLVRQIIAWYGSGKVVRRKKVKMVWDFFNYIENQKLVSKGQVKNLKQKMKMHFAKNTVANNQLNFFLYSARMLDNPQLKIIVKLLKTPKFYRLNRIYLTQAKNSFRQARTVVRSKSLPKGHRQSKRLPASK